MYSVLSSELFSQYLSTTSLLILVIAALLGIVILYNSYWNVERWEKYGVKHVDIGIMEVTNMAEVAMQGKLDTVGSWRDNLSLFTRDLELIKKITFQDFSSFVNHPNMLASSSPLRQGLFFLRDEQWKRVRQLMSPSFSTSKLKGMSDVMQTCASRLATAFEEHAHAGKLVNMYHLAGQYTSAITARTAFGLHTESNIGRDSDDRFTYCAKNIVKIWTSNWQRYFVLFLERFPKLHCFMAQKLKLNFVDECNKDSMVYFNALLEQAIEEREKVQRGGRSKDYQDFLQNLVAAKVARDVKVAKGTPEFTNHPEVGTAAVRPEHILTHEEVLAQSLIILFAGFEMTTTALQYTFYQLAAHPKLQEKVCQEIQEVVHSEQPTHEELGKLRYMDQVINESMRLLPPVAIVGRDAKETRTYGDVTIPAGSTIYLAIMAIHRDPKHYPDPDRFDPDRFSEKEKAKRNPLAFAPFGYGPRLCIGSRLVLQKMKIALVHALRKFTFEVNDKTIPRKGEEPEVYYSVQLSRFIRPIQLQVKVRNG
ncbi:cytochrome P450 [Elysia marginata]|uniref:Cytochrome P450 n=1 Tax=Elysia marginata TaxID=1093978 RepID=A0AAV4HU53_9GAST|nr:cytochrome P450 [Elysia marginata]